MLLNESIPSPTHILQIFIDMKLGIEIQYSGGHIFEMKVRPSYQSNICGLCGNYNLDPADDFTTGPKCAGPNAPYTIVSSH